jgi:small nuclear ribonucleoprotein (snRNP)-like protein
MKHNLLVITIIGMLIITACNSKTDVVSTLDNSENRKEIYSAIMNDHQMMTEFMEMMNEHAMMMMKEGHMMSGNLEGMDDMISLYMNDSIACDQLTDSMMIHQGMMYMMLDKMHSKGMIDKSTKKEVEQQFVQQYDIDKIRHWH